MIKTKFLIACILLLSCSRVWSADQVEMKRCSLQQNDLKRLACYDQLAKGIPSALVVPPLPITNNNNSSMVATPRNAFGLENKMANESADSIESTIQGEFKGWTGKTLFKLANGQVWKQTNSGSVIYHAMDPGVTISKGVFGSFRLKVAGLNKTVNVRRVK